nr:hypothetical protein [Tanacetum cinerariifolium]
MTRDRSQLTNFVNKFLDTIKFGNDHIAKIMGYGDFQIGNVTILRVYYVEGLGHNLFSVGQFCDSDLETKSWLWHRRLSYLNFGALNHLAKNGLVRGKTISSAHGSLWAYTYCKCKWEKYILVIMDDYSRFTWVKFLASKDEASDFIIKFLKMIQVRLNATVRNIRTDNETEFVNQTLKPDLSYLHVFGALCYPKNDNEDLGKLQAKVDIGIFVGYAPKKKAHRIYNRRTRKIIKTIHVDFDELTAMASEQLILVANAPRAIDLANTPVSTSIDQDAPSKNSTSQGSSSNVRPTYTPFESLEPKNFKQAMIEPSWIDAMQEEIHAVKRLQVWELVSCPDKVIFINPNATIQIAFDNALVPPKARLKIGVCNRRIEFSKPQREATYQITLDALNLSLCYLAFLITANTYFVYASDAKEPIKARKFKKPASPIVKTVPVSPKEPIKKPAKKPEHVNMDDPNITIEEYIRFEEEKAQKRGKVFNWETAKYGKIWYDKDVHDLKSIETEFPAIVFNDNLTSDKTLSCEPTVSSLKDNEIDFRISFDESDDEDYTVVFDKKSFYYKIIYANDLKMDSENNNEKVNMPLFPSPEPSVSCIDDLDFFNDFENKFPAIVYNDALMSKSDFSTEPTLCPQHIDEFNLKDETSLFECDEKEQNVLYFDDLFPFNVIYPNDLKLDTKNDDDKIEIKQSSGDMFVIPLPNVLNTDVGAYTRGSNMLLKTSHGTSNKFFRTETFVKELNVNIVACN